MPPKFGKRSKVEDRDKQQLSKEKLSRSLKIFRYVLPYRFTFGLGLLFLFLSSVTLMVFPRFTGMLVDSAVYEDITRWGGRNNIALVLLGVFLLQGLFSFFRVLLFARVNERAMRDIRSDLYQRIISLPIAFFEEKRVGELNSRMTNDITQLSDMLSTTSAEFIRQFIILLVGIGYIFFESPQLAGVMLATFPVLMAGAAVFGRYIRRISRQVQDELAEANTIVEETFQAIHSVKTFTNELFETLRYRRSLDHVLKHALKAATYRGLFASFVIVAIFGGIVFVMWYGLGLVEQGQMTIGDLISFLFITSLIGGSVGGLGQLYGQLQKTIGASSRILEILEEAPELEVGPDKDYPAFQGHIRYESVQFAYPTRPDVPVLKALSFEILPGQKVALVGPSGAGKSTIVQLLLRFYPVQSGDIKVDGKSINQMELHELRSHIGIVPQEVLLFGGTIRENIAYGKPEASEAEIREAARKAYALEFVESFPNGLDTLVGERGIKLSGGQKQRIAIARAVLKNPAILLLDEATSSLDAESEVAVQLALEELMKNRTSIIIAHRLATVRKADRILVIEDGQIKESGTHEQLSEDREGLYGNLVRLQFEH